MSLKSGTLATAFAAACVTGAASAVGIVVGLTVAPAILATAAAIEVGSIVVGGASGITLANRAGNAIVDTIKHINL